jgi:DNA/RNA-binding domain of Phe-tRNA-synthetase-like protein
MAQNMSYSNLKVLCLSHFPLQEECKMLEVQFDPYVQQALPHVLLGLLKATIEATSIQARERAPGLSAMLDELCEHLRFQYQGKAAVDRPEIAATRRAYRAIGDDPTRYRPANEALLRRVLSHRAISALETGRQVERSSGIPFVHTAVDIHTYVSLESGFAIGCYDAAKLAGPITLRRGHPGERYIPIGKPEVDATNRLVLADEHGIFGSPTADSQRTMITTETTYLLFVIFAFEVTEAALEHALSRTADLLTWFCDATIIERRVVEPRTENQEPRG